jgi:hypothetical protein
MGMLTDFAQAGNEPYFLGYESFYLLFEGYGELSERVQLLRKRMLERATSC